MFLRTTALGSLYHTPTTWLRMRARNGRPPAFDPRRKSTERREHCKISLPSLLQPTDPALLPPYSVPHFTPFHSNLPRTLLYHVPLLPGPHIPSLHALPRPEGISLMLTLADQCLAVFKVFTMPFSPHSACTPKVPSSWQSVIAPRPAPTCLHSPHYCLPCPPFTPLTRIDPRHTKSGAEYE